MSCVFLFKEKEIAGLLDPKKVCHYSDDTNNILLSFVKFLELTYEKK